MPKVLVTGATGFLGNNLVKELKLSGYNVRVLVRKNADSELMKNIDCEVHYGQIDNKEDVLNAISGCDIVVHAASLTEQWNIAYSEYERINIAATKYITDACVQRSVQKFIYVSTANTIAPGSIEQPGNELNGFTLFNINSGYINSKYLAQQYVVEQAERKGLNAVVVNPTFMVGPNDVKPSSGKLTLYALGKRLLFYPAGGKNFVYITDVCKGIIAAIEKGKKGSSYLLANENLTYKQFFKMVAKIAGERKILIPIPKWSLLLAGMVGTLLVKLGLNNIRLTYATAYLLCLDNYYSGKKSERELGLNYTPIYRAAKEAYNWFHQKGYIN